MYNDKTLTVVMPAYNEEANIAAAVEAFRVLPEVDVVLVVNNNSRDRTEVEARRAGARVILETQQGYGYACRRGLVEADTDLVAIVEPDGTFCATDLYKFLAYIHEFDVVFGTRTSWTCIWEGANMGFALRYGNVVVAKMLEYLHNGPCLSDVGCTFKMLTREAIAAVKNYFTVGKSHFSPELMILCIRRKLRCVEIPVNYRPRIGESKITGDIHKAVKLGLIMIGLIGKYRLKRIPPLSGASDKSMLLLAQQRCRPVAATDAGDAAPREREADESMEMLGAMPQQVSPPPQGPCPDTSA